MIDAGRLDHLLENRWTNAALSWLLVLLSVLVAVENLLDGDLLWTGFAAVLLGLAVVPPAVYRDATVMLPWEVLLLAGLPMLGRAVATFPVFADLAAYLSVAALALVVAVELDVFTPVRMNNWFAVLFVVIATMATAGVWAVVQWLSDLLLGTTFLYPTSVPRPPAVADPGLLADALWLSDVLFGTAFVSADPLQVSRAADAAALDALMWDFVAATAAGILAGVVFEWYFRRRTEADVRLPEGLAG